MTGSHVVLDFRSKHGIRRHLDLQDRRLARIVRRLRDLPGQDLFQHVDDEGETHPIGSEDVNDYLREVSGEEITAKDFRTWAATNLAALALRELEAFDSAAKAKKNVVQAVETVAKLLGNTPAICRKCYIHPAIFEGYLDGSLLAGLKSRADAALQGDEPGLTAEEVAVTAFLSRATSLPAPPAWAHSSYDLPRARYRGDRHQFIARGENRYPRTPEDLQLGASAQGSQRYDRRRHERAGGKNLFAGFRLRTLGNDVFAWGQCSGRLQPECGALVFDVFEHGHSVGPRGNGRAGHDLPCASRRKRRRGRLPGAR